MCLTRAICLSLMLGSAFLSHAEEWRLEQGESRLVVSSEGRIVGLQDSAGHDLAASGGALIEFAIFDQTPTEQAWRGEGALWQACDSPAHAFRDEGGVLFAFDARPGAPFKILLHLAFVRLGEAVAVRQAITLTPTLPSFGKIVALRVASPVALPAGDMRVFVPRQDGLGEEIKPEPARCWTWPLDGQGHAITGPEQHLAIPMMSASRGGAPAGDSSGRVTHVADPFFTTSFSLSEASGRWGIRFEYAYLGTSVPLRGELTRTFWSVIHSGPPEAAMEQWYATALADVAPGPAWLHDVGWQHYDFLSHGGKGWFEDIDAAEKIVPQEQRQNVLFTLHGWYDMLGRYTFNGDSGRLDDTWVAFPSAAAVQSKGFPTSESVAMTKAEMHRRLRYAKERGFRVGLYFADGLTACEGAGVFSEDKLLEWGGWQGPDTVGRPYKQNPAHPAVFEWYRNYLEALLAEYGNEIDALVWDETFMIRAGMTAPSNAPEPAYLCGAFMRLAKELTRITGVYRADLAFLASDCIGAPSEAGRPEWTDVPPYAIVCHGCYQDSHANPFAWPYGLFPNLRNILWSCNWSAVTHLDYTRFGVLNYRTPVATSNGWLDDKGIARLTEAQRADVIALLNKRMGLKQELHWLSGPPPAP